MFLNNNQKEIIMRNVLGTALMALALAGCGVDIPSVNNSRMLVNLTDEIQRELHVGFVLTVSVPPELEASRDVSLDYWDEELETELFVPAEDGEKADIEVLIARTNGWGRALPDWTASYPDWVPLVTGGVIKISPAIAENPACADAVLTHELGHLLGLEDDSNTGGIMDARGGCELYDLLDSDRALIEEDIERM